MAFFNANAAFQQFPEMENATSEGETWGQQPVLASQHMPSRSPSVQLARQRAPGYDSSYYPNTSNASPDYLTTMPHFSSTANNSFPPITSDSMLYPPRFYSPSVSGQSSSNLGSNWSEQGSTPWSSPETNAVAYTPQIAYSDVSMGAIDGYTCHGVLNATQGGSYLNIPDPQAYSDPHFEGLVVDDSDAIYGSLAQEGYQPLSFDKLLPSNAPSHLLPSFDFPQYANADTEALQPVIRRRRPQSRRTSTSPQPLPKVVKRPPNVKRATSYQNEHSITTSRKSSVSPSSSSANRAFACPFAQYGCTSTFGSKNEWKRHSQTQHMRLGFWRCDQCPLIDRKPNDFNRKDLFTQHVRRMHPIRPASASSSSSSIATTSGKSSSLAPTTISSSSAPKRNEHEEAALAAIAQRCYRHLRAPPRQSACLFCDAKFEGPSAWDERMEHVGRHLEAAKKEGDAEVLEVARWRRDGATEAWLVAEGLVGRGKGGALTLVEGREG